MNAFITFCDKSASISFCRFGVRLGKMCKYFIARKYYESVILITFSNCGTQIKKSTTFYVPHWSLPSYRRSMDVNRYGRFSIDQISIGQL